MIGKAAVRQKSLTFVGRRRSRSGGAQVQIDPERWRARPGDRGRPTVALRAAEERPPSLGTVAPCKRGAREDRQGRRNDTARAEDDPPGGDVDARTGETATPHRSKSKQALRAR